MQFTLLSRLLCLVLLASATEALAPRNSGNVRKRAEQRQKRRDISAGSSSAARVLSLSRRLDGSAMMAVAPDARAESPKPSFPLPTEPLKYLGPLFFMSIQATSLRTAWSIYLAKSVGKLSPVPFVSLLACGYVWAVYGALKGDNTVMIPNASAVVVASICTAVFHMFDPTPALGVYAVAGAAMGLVTVLAAMKKVATIGLFGAASAILMMASPLATVQTVIAEKSTAALPFLPSFVSWANGLSWALYGLLLAKDMTLAVPNAIGCFFGTIQLLLFARYGLPPKPIVA